MFISVEMIVDTIEQINSKIKYDTSAGSQVPPEMMPPLLTCKSNGVEHEIHFVGIVLWRSLDQERYESLSLEQQVELNGQSNFERFIRLRVMQEIETLNQINLLGE